MQNFGKQGSNQRLRYTLGDTLPDISSLSIMAPIASAQKQAPVTEEGYTIKPVTEKDHEKALEHLRKFFFRDEPLNINVELLVGEDARCNELEDYALSSMAKGDSLMAVSDSGNIVGIVINYVIDKNEGDHSDPSLTCSNKKFSKILRLLYVVDRDANVFGQFPDVEKIMNVAILSVDSSWRGRGLAKILTDRSRDCAIERGIQMMRVDCSSHFSARVASRLGFECVFTLPYADYFEDGEQVFSPAAPHTQVCVYIQKVPIKLASL